MNLDWIIGAVVLVAWLVFMFLVYPKMGVPTGRRDYSEPGTRKKKCSYILPLPFLRTYFRSRLPGENPGVRRTCSRWVYR